MGKVYAAVLAGGIGTRMGNVEKPKQFMEIGGKPIIIHTLEKFAVHPGLEKVLVLSPRAWVGYTSDIIKKYIPMGADIPVIEGGSTITEQIAKNLYLGGYINGMEEKIAGIYLLFDLEKHYSKQELLALYVNMNYYGDSYYGIAKAAEGYYDASVGDLTLAQAAMLAGLPNAPSIYQLSTGYEMAKQRQEWVLKTMQDNGWITEEERIEAMQEDMHPLNKP